MDELELESGGGENFIPCLKWVKRGVAKSEPEKVKLSQDELAAIIQQTQKNITDLENDVQGDDEDAQEDTNDGMKDGHENEDKGETDVVKEYDLENYDDDDTETMANIGDLVAFADPRKDPFLRDPDLDEDQSDIEDLTIKPTDNLCLVGHVEGNASILEVYVYNDVENALYIHHDILLPSYPLALEWLSYDPGEDVKGNFCAIGTMNPIIEVWDLDLIDSLEPAFVLGCKGSKKKKIKAIGHKDAVLSLAWNYHTEHILASGSVDQTVILWDLNKGTVASKLTSHKEKVQTLQWHPIEKEILATGCCDEQLRIFDCRTENGFKSWKCQGEVEKVLWNHFNASTCLVATEAGYIQMVDVRQESKPIWTLQAHSEGVNGLSLSTQCPDCLVSVSSDRTMKSWDISDNKPKCVWEKNLSLGRLHSLDGCPDAPFVVAVGGDKAQNNLKIMDIRESSDVRETFGDRPLQKNPFGASEFGFPTANAAEPKDKEDDNDAMEEAFEAMSVETENKPTYSAENKGSGVGAKFRKDKKTKKKKKF